MKYLLILILMSAAIPQTVLADRALSVQEAWQYRYEFTYAWDGQHLTPSAPYGTSSGEETVMVPGLWRLEILNEGRRPLAIYDFNPAAMAEGGTVTLRVPLEGSGFYAVVYTADGSVEHEMRVSASRVCNDNGSCDRNAGEESWLCPDDCGMAASAGQTVQSATLADQVPVGTRVSGLLLKLSLALAGATLLIGSWQLLDSRKRP